MTLGLEVWTKHTMEKNKNTETKWYSMFKQMDSQKKRCDSFGFFSKSHRNIFK